MLWSSLPHAVRLGAPIRNRRAAPMCTFPTVPARGRGGGSGADGGDPKLPPIDPSTAIETLTPSQRAELCDWMTNQLGRYGFTTVCASGNQVSTAANQVPLSLPVGNIGPIGYKRS